MRTEVTPKGEGTEANPYQITSIANLLWISNEAKHRNTDGKFYKMMNDIDASLSGTWNNSAGFKPIGRNMECAFKGTFDGNNKTITDLHINRTSSSETLFIGLFGCTREATIKNLELKNASISGTAKIRKGQCIEIYAGILAGRSFLCVITNCTVSGSVTGYSDYAYSAVAGGLVGHNHYGTITECTVLCDVKGATEGHNANARTGVFVGQNSCGTITNCTASGTAISECHGNESYAYSGGFVGLNNCCGTITECTASCEVTGSGSHYYNYTGKFAGYNSGTISMKA